MNNPTVKLIERFACALDMDDFDLAINLLDSDCIYETSAETLTGPQAVIKSFRDASQWAHENLDSIVYLHSLLFCPDCTAVIKFVDQVEHRAEQMQHTCLMHVTLGKNDKVIQLRLEDLPGEKQKVADFLAAVGLKR